MHFFIHLLSTSTHPSSQTSSNGHTRTENPSGTWPGTARVPCLADRYRSSLCCSHTHNSPCRSWSILRKAMSATRPPGPSHPVRTRCKPGETGCMQTTCILNPGDISMRKCLGSVQTWGLRIWKRGPEGSCSLFCCRWTISTALPEAWLTLHMCTLYWKAWRWWSSWPVWW